MEFRNSGYISYWISWIKPKCTNKIIQGTKNPERNCSGFSLLSRLSNGLME